MGMSRFFRVFMKSLPSHCSVQMSEKLLNQTNWSSRWNTLSVPKPSKSQNPNNFSSALSWAPKVQEEFNSFRCDPPSSILIHHFGGQVLIEASSPRFFLGQKTFSKPASLKRASLVVPKFYWNGFCRQHSSKSSRWRNHSWLQEVLWKDSVGPFFVPFVLVSGVQCSASMSLLCQTMTKGFPPFLLV